MDGRDPVRINAHQNVVRGCLAAMTLHAPTHRQRPSLVHSVHGPWIPVADFTGHALSHVALMIEANEIRELMHPNPLDGAALRKGFLYPLNPGAVALDHRVAIHTDIQRRHRGVLGFLRADVTVNALQLQLPRVQSMAERNRLLRRIVLVACSGPNSPQPRHSGDRDDQTHKDCQCFLISVLHILELPPT